MRTFFRAVATTAILATSVVLGLPVAANAATCHHVHQQTASNVGLLNGTQVYAPVGADVSITDLVLGLLGSASDSRPGDTTSTVTCS